LNGILFVPHKLTAKNAKAKEKNGNDNFVCSLQKGKNKTPRITVFFFAFRFCAPSIVSISVFFFFAFVFLFLCAVFKNQFCGVFMHKLTSGAVVHLQQKRSGWLFQVLFFQKNYLVNWWSPAGHLFSKSFQTLNQAYAFYLFIQQKQRYKIS
jgi:hypothetical protein